MIAKNPTSVFCETVTGKPTNFDMMRQRLERAAGLLPAPKPKYRLSDLERSEWSPEFERLMRNRLLMGALRYGPIGAPNKPQYDRVGSIEKRLRTYSDTGNKELLVDCANLCLMEFVECAHPKAHFEAQDNSTHHVTKI
jgi:hypothetical protein